MKKLFIICSLLLMVVFTVSCEKETTNLPENLKLNKQQNDILNFKSTSDMVEAGFDLDAYRSSSPVKKNSKTQVNSKTIDEEAGLVFYTDESEFLSDGCDNLSVEDFEPSNQGYWISIPGTLDENTNNGFYLTGDILPNIAINASPTDAVVSTNYNNSYEVHSTWFVDVLNINFNPSANINTVSMDLFRWIQAGDIDIEIFGISGSLGMTTVSVDWIVNLPRTFWGVQSNEVITKITLRSADDGGYFDGSRYHDAEGIDNLSFGTTCDSDGDGVNDNLDNCPETANAGQEDYDEDGIGDVCDDDDDNDGILDVNDNCPNTANAGQEDNDGDGMGDACDDDDDNDGILDVNDNCPNTANAGQEDYDEDGIGDVCDDDIDGDGCENNLDPIDYSDIGATVEIDGCDYGITNYVTGTCGLTMNDMINTLEAGTYKNHGAFIKAMSNLVNSWYYGGLITLAEKDLIMMCAGESSIGS